LFTESIAHFGTKQQRQEINHLPSKGIPKRQKLKQQVLNVPDSLVAKGERWH